MLSTSSDMQQQWRDLRMGVVEFACVGSPFCGMEDGTMRGQSLGDGNLCPQPAG